MKDLEVKMNEIESEREVLEKQILNLIMKIDHKVDQIEGTWWKIFEIQLLELSKMIQVQRK